MTQIHITRFDLERIEKLLFKRKPLDKYEEALLAELSKAEIIEPETVPHDVITMNSQIRFKDEHDDSWEYQLVFPEDANLAENKISILSPVGCSLIGYRVGDSMVIPTPQGRKELQVEAVTYQPERSGEFHL